jgi:hypothetical protein
VFYEVERLVAGRVSVLLEPHTGGTVHRPEQILDAILKCSTPRPAGTPALQEVSR